MLAWALSLAAWIALPALALGHRPGDAVAAALLLAAWLATQAAVAHAAGGARTPTRRALRLAATALATSGLLALLRGHDAIGALTATALGWGALQGLSDASDTGARASARTTLVAAALAWIVLGDYTDPLALTRRLAFALPLAGAFVAWRDAPIVATRGIGACLLPLRADAAWSLRLAAWSMLPMMCALPWMASLCRDAAWPPSADLGLHYLLMFAPAALSVLRTVTVDERRVAKVSVGLLGVGIALFATLPGSLGWLALTAGQGLAWALVAQAARDQSDHLGAPRRRVDRAGAHRVVDRAFDRAGEHPRRERRARAPAAGSSDHGNVGVVVVGLECGEIGTGVTGCRFEQRAMQPGARRMHGDQSIDQRDGALVRRQLAPAGTAHRRQHVGEV